MAKQPAKKPAAKPAKKPTAKKPTTTARKAVSKAPATRKPATPKVKLVASESLVAPTGKSKFTLFNLLGQPQAYYIVERVELERPKGDAKPNTIAHSIIVIDRSGSMYGQMREVRDTLLKLLHLEEYKRFNLVFSLISYSSAGDATCHFQRMPIADIMKPGSKEQQQIKRLEATCLTCLSDGLQLAADLTRDGELTGITLHTDGYTNDPSAHAETIKLQALCKKLQAKNVVLNTIAYSDSADFRLLSRLANSLSGSCVKTADIQVMYDTLYEHTKTLGTSTVPPIGVPLPPGCEFQVFVSRGARRVNGGAGDLKILGVKPEHDAAVYQYRRVSEKDYHAAKDVPVVQTSEAVYAFAKGKLAEGHLNTAKYAIASAFDATMILAHGKALTNLQCAALAADLDRLLRQPNELQHHQILSEVPVNRRIPLVGVIGLLEKHADDYLLNLPYLQDHYARPGVKRLQGTRDNAGNLIEPWLRTEYVESDEDIPVSGFEVNRNSATMNLLIRRRVRLVKTKGGGVITEVAGVNLDQLRSFNSYTVVSDGELNLDKLKLRITGKKLFDALVKEGILEDANGTPASKHDPKAAYFLRLDSLPLVPPFEGSIDLNGVFDQLCGLKILASLCGAHLKEAARDFTSEQVEELKKHYLTKSLLLNFPTTTPYTDRLTALSQGILDTRTSYKIDIGNKQILNLSKLHSANKFLERMYEVKAGEQLVEKPKFEDAVGGHWKYGFKQLSSRVKVTKVDELMKDYFDEFLGLKPTGKTVAVLETVGAKDLAKIVQARLRGDTPDAKAFVAALTDAREKLETEQERLFRNRLQSLVFYIGSTGLLPEEIDVKAQTADQISNKYPDLTLSKDEREGTFFEIGDVLLTVYATTEDFSRETAK
ncbi:MAG: VWA domain-containing protein [Fimbriiglobus sp.]|nr:VWA domain-containing protein [Fimbriiglobus sp.]